MGIHEYLCRLEKKLDAEYKESSTIAKILQRHSPTMIAAGLAFAALAAPFIGAGYHSAKQNYKQQIKQEAIQEVQQYKNEFEQKLIKQKHELDSGWEQLNKEREELYQKKRDMDFREIEVNSDNRMAKFDQRYLAIKEQILEARNALLSDKLDKREQSLDAKAESLHENQKKIERMLYSAAKKSLPFYSAKIE